MLWSLFCGFRNTVVSNICIIAADLSVAFGLLRPNIGYISGICSSHVLLVLSVQANKSHGSRQYCGAGRGITTWVLIETHLWSQPLLSVISFISVQASTLQHSGSHRGHYQSIGHKKKRRRVQVHIFRKCCSVQSCGKLVLLQLLILVCSASQCRCITLADFDGGKEGMRLGLV